MRQAMKNQILSYLNFTTLGRIMCEPFTINFFASNLVMYQITQPCHFYLLWSPIALLMAGGSSVRSSEVISPSTVVGEYEV